MVPQVLARALTTLVLAPLAIGAVLTMLLIILVQGVFKWEHPITQQWYEALASWIKD